MGDHPPITPMKSAEKVYFDEIDWKVYSFIAKNFFATISKKAQYEIQTVAFKIGDEDFILKGRKLLQYGFLEVAPWLGSTDDQDLPKFSEGDEYQISHLTIVERETSPP